MLISGCNIREVLRNTWRVLYEKTFSIFLSVSIWTKIKPFCVTLSILRFEEKKNRNRFQSKERSHDGGSCCQISRLAFCNFSFFQSYFQIVICLCSFLTIPGENSIVVVIVAVVNLVHLVNGIFFHLWRKNGSF